APFPFSSFANGGLIIRRPGGLADTATVAKAAFSLGPIVLPPHNVREKWTATTDCVATRKQNGVVASGLLTRRHDGNAAINHGLDRCRIGCRTIRGSHSARGFSGRKHVSP